VAPGSLLKQRHPLLSPGPERLSVSAEQADSAALEGERKTVTALFARSVLPKIVEYGLATEREILDILDQLRNELVPARGFTPLSWLMIAQWARKPDTHVRVLKEH
jgi:hypothetical protein